MNGTFELSINVRVSPRRIDAIERLIVETRINYNHLESQGK